MASGRRYDCVRTIVKVGRLWLRPCFQPFHSIVLLYVRSHNVDRRPYSSACELGYALWVGLDSFVLDLVIAALFAEYLSLPS